MSRKVFATLVAGFAIATGVCSFASAAASNFSNGVTTLQITPSAAAFVTMPNSGNTGLDFNVGASFPITTTTTEGVYTGNLTVTVDYN